MTYVHLDRITNLSVLLAVETIVECGLGSVIGLLFGDFRSGVIKSHAQIHLFAVVDLYSLNL